MKFPFPSFSREVLASCFSATLTVKLSPSESSTVNLYEISSPTFTRSIFSPISRGVKFSKTIIGIKMCYCTKENLLRVATALVKFSPFSNVFIAKSFRPVAAKSKRQALLSPQSSLCSAV